MSVRSEMYKPQFPFYCSDHHNLSSTHHLDEMLSAGHPRGTPGPLRQTVTFTSAALSVALSCVGWYLWVSFPLPFMTAASPCCLLFLWDLFCLPPKVPLMVVFTTVPSATHSSSLSTHPGDLTHAHGSSDCCHTNGPHTFLFPSSLSQSSILNNGPASPAGVLKNLNFNSSTK